MTQIEHLILSNQLAIMKSMTLTPDVGRLLHNIMMTRVFLEEQTKPKAKTKKRRPPRARDDSQPA